MEPKDYKLSEIIEAFISGDWGEESSSLESPNAVRCVRGADIVPIWNSDYDHIPIRFVSNRSFANKQLKVGDIIIEKSGGSPTQSTGRTAFVSEELISNATHLVCTNFCTAFRIKPGWNPKYVYYYLQHLYNNDVFFNFEGKTSGLKNLQIENAFDKATITQIPIEKQNQIVEVLDTLDRKIALNRAINRNLEALAKQLYDYWFVQFDFPDENGRPYKSSGGKMVWNDVLKHNIPVEWSECDLNYYIGRITNGLNPRKNFVLGSGNNYYVTIRSLVGTDIEWNDCDRCDDEALKKINSRSQLQIGDVIFSAIGTIGRTYFIQEGPNNWNISETSFTLRARENVSPYFFYALLRSEEIQKNADKKAMGSTLRCLVMDSLCKIPTIKVSDKIIERFVERVKPIYKKIYGINKENSLLIKHRDELLPLLMNGQVTIE